jgi:hypothetical protein
MGVMTEPGGYPRDLERSVTLCDRRFTDIEQRVLDHGVVSLVFTPRPA